MIWLPRIWANYNFLYSKPYETFIILFLNINKMPHNFLKILEADAQE